MEFGIFLGFVATVIWAIYKVVQFFKEKVRKYGGRKVLAATLEIPIGIYLFLRLAVKTYMGEVEWQTIMLYVVWALGAFLVAFALWWVVRVLRKTKEEIRDSGWIYFLVMAGSKAITYLTLGAMGYLLFKGLSGITDNRMTLRETLLYMAGFMTLIQAVVIVKFIIYQSMEFGFNIFHSVLVFVLNLPLRVGLIILPFAAIYLPFADFWENLWQNRMMIIVAPIVLFIFYIFFTTKTYEDGQADVYGSYEWKTRNGLFDEIY